MALIGCTEEYKLQHSVPVSSINVETPNVVQKKRIEVKLIQKMTDYLAYNDIRGVYLIKDNLTGQEFIGISGIGISELGSHQSGKTTKEDER